MSRIIDFALSNAINSGIRRIGVATQYKAHSLIRHMQRAWNFLRPERNESFDILPASQRVSETQWYEGTADAVFQNIDIIEGYAPRYMVILAGDHIYKMDYELMLRQHVNSGADVTVGCLVVPQQGRQRLRRDGGGREQRHHQLRRKARRTRRPSPAIPTCRWPRWASTCSRPGSCSTSCAAMPPTPARSAISAATSSPTSSGTARRWRTSFTDSCIRAAEEIEEYWRDVGTLDAYFDANLDLTDVVPRLNMYDRDWPIWTDQIVAAPAKFVHDEDGRRGQAISSLISQDCIVSGATATRSLLFTGVKMG